MNMKAIIFIALIALAIADVEKDLVTKEMPHCNVENKMYSGYLDLGEGREHHYIYVEATKDPENAPLMFWFNGGPGCSSMIGFITENGPCNFMDDGDLYPSDNPYAWTDTMNMVFLESPSGVGYNNNDKKFTYDDESVSYENLKSVQTFFKGFPELKSRDLYLSGESYAGIYVPYLALRIVEFNELDTTPENEKINLTGMIIGNAVTDWKYDTQPALIEMAYEHGLIDIDTKRLIDSNPDCHFMGDGFGGPQPAVCKEIIRTAQKNMVALNPYDIYRHPEEYYYRKSIQDKMVELVSDAP